jgi:hypothetical protein
LSDFQFFFGDPYRHQYMGPQKRIENRSKESPKATKARFVDSLLGLFFVAEFLFPAFLFEE